MSSFFCLQKQLAYAKLFALGLFFRSSQAWLGLLLFSLFMLGSVNGYCSNGPHFIVKDFPGLQAKVTVTAMEDGAEEADVLTVSRRTDFIPLSEKQFKPLDLHPVWLKIDLEVPPALLGQTAWLEISPAYIYDLRLYQSGADEQRSGIRLAFSQHNARTLAPTFQVDLKQPLTRVYLRLYGAAVHIAQFKLMSAEALHQSQMQVGQLNAFFFGVLFLILILNLLNWVWTQEKIFRSYTAFLTSAFAFFLLANN